MANFTVPSPNAKAVEDNGQFSVTWYKYLAALAPLLKAPTEASITVTASPFAYTVQAAGTVLVQGGTVSGISLKRTSSHATGVTGGFIPVGRGDVLTVTYSVGPTMTFFPS